MENTEAKESTYPLTIENHGVTSLSELFQDRVVYRNLEPVERGWSGLKRIRSRFDLDQRTVPRKLEEKYGAVVDWMIDQAQSKRRARFRELLLIGDTPTGDVSAFQNIRRQRDLAGSVFIGKEVADEEARNDFDEEIGIFRSNRWRGLADWAAWLQERKLNLDQDTVLVVDIDKTALGARGRNDRAIDAARLKGLYRKAKAVLGESFDPHLFEEHYDSLNRSRYHRVTEDNQDYLAYICLVLNNDAIDCVDLLGRLKEGSIDSFRQFVRYVEACIAGGAQVRETMRQVHEAVNTAVSLGDPTPFKSFRREEFLATLEHMNNLPDDVPPAERLNREITITQEVREFSLWLAGRGCLVMSLSDKPDEASLPDRVVHRGKPPIHEAETHAVGATIADDLARLD